MRVVEGQHIIRLPEACEPSTMDIMAFSGGIRERCDEGYWVALYRIEWAAMMMMDSDKRALRGVPTQYAISPQCDEIVYHPSSDKEHDMAARYCPALKEI